MLKTEHFTEEEMTRSSTAKRNGIDNSVQTGHRLNLLRCMRGLEEVREIVGKPVHVTSGYRSPELNRAVGGVPTSAHAKGCAADIYVNGVTAYRLAKLLEEAKHEGKLDFDQLILETSRNVVHISFDKRMRGQVKTQAGGPGSPVVWGLKEAD